MPELVIRHDRVEGFSHGAVITLSGSSVTSSAPELDEIARQLLGSKLRYFVFDLGDCRFLSSAVLGVLADLAMKVKKSKGAVVLTRLPPRIKELIDQMGIGKFVSVAPSPSEAIFRLTGFKIAEPARPVEEPGAEEAHPRSSVPTDEVDLFVLHQQVPSKKNAYVVHGRGKIEGRGVQMLQEIFEKIQKEGARGIVLNLGEVRYLSSKALTYLVNVKDKLEGGGGKLILCAARPQVKVAFDKLFPGFFQHYATRDEAFAAL